MRWWRFEDAVPLAVKVDEVANKKCWQPPEARRHKETNSSLEPPLGALPARSSVRPKGRHFQAPRPRELSGNKHMLLEVIRA